MHSSHRWSVLTPFSSVEMDTQKQGLGKQGSWNSWMFRGQVPVSISDLSRLPLASPHPGAFSCAWKRGPLLCLPLGNVSSQAESNTVHRDRAGWRQALWSTALILGGSTYGWGTTLPSESRCSEPEFLRMDEDCCKVPTCFKTARMM